MVAGDPKIILIQGIAHNKLSLNIYLYVYFKMLRPLKLTLRYIRFSTNATVSIERNQDFENRNFGEVSNLDTVSNQLKIVFKSVKYDYQVNTTRTIKIWKE